jgi:hypothetical protein
MPRTRKSGSSKSNNGQVKFLRLYERLLEQKKQVDNNLLKMERKLLRQLSRQHEHQMGVRKVYVKRMHNKNTLALSIRECMTPNKEMSMKEILAALQATGLYKTRSSYFYTMVNNKLNRDPKVKKVRRGVFMFVVGTRSTKTKDDSKSSSRKTKQHTSISKTQKKDQTVAAA